MFYNQDFLSDLSERGYNGNRFSKSIKTAINDLTSDNNLTFKELYLFGSVARLSYNPCSDIDILLVYDDSTEEKIMRREAAILVDKEEQNSLSDSSSPTLNIVHAFSKDTVSRESFWQFVNRDKILLYRREVLSCDYTT